MCVCVCLFVVCDVVEDRYSYLQPSSNPYCQGLMCMYAGMPRLMLMLMLMPDLVYLSLSLVTREALRLLVLMFSGYTKVSSWHTILKGT